MNNPLSNDEARRLLFREAFRMPMVQSMLSRKSSITNAFVCALVPVIEPTIDEIAEALSILEMSPDHVRCAYCGDPATEWDHLRALVVNRRPTGYISEIGNLVPSCGKCNQSKGNKNWLQWMTSDAPRSPKARGVPDIATNIERLRRYESWKQISPIQIERIVGSELYTRYWAALDRTIDDLKTCQALADELRVKIAAAPHDSP